MEIQLCGGYLCDVRSSRGVFDIVYLGKKSYPDPPNGRRADTFEMLVDELQRHWMLISNDYPGVDDVRVIGIDLTRRGIDTKAAKKGKKVANSVAKSWKPRTGRRKADASLPPQTRRGPRKRGRDESRDPIGVVAARWNRRTWARN